jgi:hypothetical protein
MLTSSFVLISIYYLAKIRLILLSKGSRSNSLVDFCI